MAILDPRPKSLEKILQRNKYRVPVYQRVYSWGINEAEELWNDLNDNDPPYFLGILMFRAQEEKEEKWFEIVDGQQRIATLMLMLRAAVETLDMESDTRRNDIQKNYIKQKILGKDQYDFILTLNKRDKDKFWTLLEDNNSEYAPPKGTKKSSSWKNMAEVKDFFIKKFISLKNSSGVNGVWDFVVKKILNLTMVDVQLESESDVYQFFETINDRGIDLSIADLVKNRICSVSGKQDVAADDIDRISDLLGSGKMIPFLFHYCWALTESDPPEPRNKVMDWYNETISRERDNFLVNLDEYSKYYYEFTDPRKLPPSPKKDVLTYLKALGATRCYPLLLIARKLLSPKEFVRLCNAIEVLTVRHSTIAKKDAKNLEKLYQDIALDIKRGTQDLDKLIARLRNQGEEVSDSVFQGNFNDYEPENSVVAKYILLKMENDIAGEKASSLDWERLTLEHILAKGLQWDGKYEFVGRLGNMTLLSGPLNNSLSNKPYKEKLKEYKKETRIILTKELVNNYSDFTKDSIIKRQSDLIAVALGVWNPKNIR